MIEPMSEDIAGYFQTIHLMLLTQNRHGCRIRFYFAENVPDDSSVVHFTWRDIRKTAFGAVPWDHPASPIGITLNAMFPESGTFGTIVNAFLRQNRELLCARITACLQEEGFEDFSVFADEHGLEVQIES